MNLQQLLIKNSTSVEIVHSADSFDAKRANLVLAFGERTLLEETKPFKLLKEIYPLADIIICSTAGQISNIALIQNELVVTAIEFKDTPIKIFKIDLFKEGNLSLYKEAIVSNLLNDKLKSILVLSEGTYINGSELVSMLSEITPGKYPVFGGLAGDSVNFKKTIVGINEDAKEGIIALIGFYGKLINLGYSHKGGWSDYGLDQKVTKSEKNVLYKIGDEYALDFYKYHLGKYAGELPGSALLFPLSMKEHADSMPIVRTILSIDEEQKSMTFAGNIPEGSIVKLMKANFNNLIDAAYDAAITSIVNNKNIPELAIIVSCVGRKIILNEQTKEELNIVRKLYGKKTLLCGFYSYGEILPSSDFSSCNLHNQTFSIFTISED